jgi:ankyrin repeat protein
MELLIEHGANVDARNISRKTLLHLAAMFPSYDAEGVEIKLRKRGRRIAMGEYALPRVELLQHGGDVNGKDSEGHMPFQYAAMAGGKRTRLRAAGADETIRDY